MAKKNNNLLSLGRRYVFRYTLAVAVGFLIFGLISFISEWVTDGEVAIAAIVEILVAMVIGVSSLFLSAKQRKIMANQLTDFAYCVESTTRAAVLTFPSPLVVVSLGGAVQWHNRSFAEMFGRENLYEEYMQDLFPEISFNRFVESDDPTPEEYGYKGKTYLVSGEVVRTVRGELTETLVALYFTDVSDVKACRKQLSDKKTVVCSLMVDNYEEVVKTTPNANHSALVAEIEHCVNDWMEQAEGLSVRYEKDRFMILFEAAKFETLLEQKMDILRQIKLIEKGNRFPVTLSIGVGAAGETLRENQEQATAALDMALGRGGDQAVVKTEKGFQFYGAKSRELEKSTRVKARVIAHALRDLADQASRVIIMGHKNADADSLGASAGLFWALRSRKVDAYIAVDRNHNNAPALLEMLLTGEEYASRIVGEDRALSLIDGRTMLIVVDTHRPSMVEYPELLRNVDEVVLIDHHRRSEEFIEDSVLTYHEPFASSASEMVTEILQYMVPGRTMHLSEAEALYSGIYIDTKGFTFKTGVRTFETASYLRKMSVDPVKVRRLFRTDLDMYILKSNIISGAKIYRDNIALATCVDMGTDTRLVTAQAADELLNIQGIEAAFVLAEIGGNISISGRSLDSVNVQVILEKLGGGGHITIAGAQVKNNGLELAEMQLKDAIDEVLFDELPILKPR
ncbi:MAG: DHH family phosphoesterase [Clostridia bacterium]|nr:DHH family phosphoesterase [Clostridia bacterium]